MIIYYNIPRYRLHCLSYTLRKLRFRRDEPMYDVLVFSEYTQDIHCAPGFMGGSEKKKYCG